MLVPPPIFLLSAASPRHSICAFEMHDRSEKMLVSNKFYERVLGICLPVCSVPLMWSFSASRKFQSRHFDCIRHSLFDEGSESALYVSFPVTCTRVVILCLYVGLETAIHLTSSPSSRGLLNLEFAVGY